MLSTRAVALIAERCLPSNCVTAVADGPSSPKKVMVALPTPRSGPFDITAEMATISGTVHSSCWAPKASAWVLSSRLRVRRIASPATPVDIR
ncbi:MAG: hypothetical protein ABI140_05245 [Jatrophihabitantaceae bacterium]